MQTNASVYPDTFYQNEFFLRSVSKQLSRAPSHACTPTAAKALSHSHIHAPIAAKALVPQLRLHTNCGESVSPPVTPAHQLRRKRKAHGHAATPIAAKASGLQTVDIYQC